MSTNPALAEILPIIDQIEQLVENGKGWMGKRVVPEEEFFVHIQRLRAALSQLPSEGTPSSTVTARSTISGDSKPVQAFIEESTLLTRQEQLQIVAALSTRLAEE